MSLHPMLRLALTQADDPDAVEKACKGNWDRVMVSGDDSALVVVKKDGTLKAMFALVPLSELVPVHEVMSISEVQALPDIEVPAQGTTTYVEELPRPLVIVDSLTELQERLNQKVLAEAQAEEPAPGTCRCGCGLPITQVKTGRVRLYATNACRARYNDRGRDRSNEAEQKRAQRAAAKERAQHPTTPVPVPELVEPEPPAPQPKPEPVACPHCHLVDDHDADECPQAPVEEPSTPVDEPVEEDASQRSVREAKERVAIQKANRKAGGQAREVITCARCHEKGHSIFGCTKPREQGVVVVPALEGEVTNDDLAAHTVKLQEICAKGLPARFQYSFLPDVLAIYGIDHDLLDSCLRSPERVEIRPESFDKEKRYGVLGFYRGDLEVILGMRSPASPKVIAAYAHSRLEHDEHRVGHAGTGGGGSKGSKGLPKTSKQVAQRLRAHGAEVEINITDDHVPVMYQGQSLGKIACNGDRATAEQDFQRTLRKMEAIDRRATAG